MNMNEKNIVHKQLLKNMLFTFIAFSIIFSIFDLIVYNKVKYSIFNTIDKEISETIEQIKQNSQILNRLEMTRNSQQVMTGTIYNNTIENKLNENMVYENEKKDNGDNKVNILENKIEPKPPMLEEKEPKGKFDFSPRLVFIVRDKDENIISGNNTIGLNNDLNESIEFDKNNLDINYSMNVNGYYYRGKNFETDYDGEKVYIQILANVDGEVQTVNSTLKTLIITTSITVIIAIYVSYVLSRITLKPIVESMKRQTEFVQNASHELRTPLTIIQAKQELLLQEPNRKIIDKSKDITICINETRRLSKMVKELMTLAKADSNKLEINKEKFDINKLIEEVAEPFKELAVVQNKKINVDLKYRGEVNLDKNKISELLVIVLDNALKYTLKGDEITISTANKENKLLLEIADTGIGISEEGLKNIFIRFYREDKARNRETGGNGLGLSIAQTIVQSHNGSIKLTKNEPKGTKVIIKI